MGICYKCGSEFADDALYCTTCGTSTVDVPTLAGIGKRTRRCQNCGGTLKAESRTCPHCGRSTVSTAAREQSDVLTILGPRRLLPYAATVPVGVIWAVAMPLAQRLAPSAVGVASLLLYAVSILAFVIIDVRLYHRSNVNYVAGFLFPAWWYLLTRWNNRKTRVAAGGDKPWVPWAIIGLAVGASFIQWVLQIGWYALLGWLVSSPAG
jgi:hypothetical protein